MEKLAYQEEDMFVSAAGSPTAVSKNIDIKGDSFSLPLTKSPLRNEGGREVSVTIPAQVQTRAILRLNHQLWLLGKMCLGVVHGYFFRTYFIGGINFNMPILVPVLCFNTKLDQSINLLDVWCHTTHC